MTKTCVELASIGRLAQEGVERWNTENRGMLGSFHELFANGEVYSVSRNNNINNNTLNSREIAFQRTDAKLWNEKRVGVRSVDNATANADLGRRGFRRSGQVETTSSSSGGGVRSSSGIGGEGDKISKSIRRSLEPSPSRVAIALPISAQVSTPTDLYQQPHQPSLRINTPEKRLGLGSGESKDHRMISPKPLSPVTIAITTTVSSTVPPTPLLLPPLRSSDISSPNYRSIRNQTQHSVSYRKKVNMLTNELRKAYEEKEQAKLREIVLKQRKINAIRLSKG